MAYIDISHTLSSNLPHWPANSQDPKIKKVLSVKRGDTNNLTWLGTDIHIGTHIDAPYHFIENGKKIDQLNLENLIGPCYVLDTKDAKTIDRKLLESHSAPKNTSRILFKTSNAKLWEDKEFHKDFVALSADAAQWIVDNKIVLAGIDYLSIQPFEQPGNETHIILLKNDIIIIEGLDLRNASEGIYELIALPIKISDSEGGPVRAILKTIN